MNLTIDMFNRIRNAQASDLPTVDVSFSNLNYGIARILEREGFIGEVRKKKSAKRNKKKSFPALEIVLKYREKVPAVSSIKAVSRPGQRIYVSWKGVKKAKGGLGIAIISTPKGLMTDKEAVKQKLGGEMICKLW